MIITVNRQELIKQLKAKRDEISAKAQAEQEAYDTAIKEIVEKAKPLFEAKLSNPESYIVDSQGNVSITVKTKTTIGYKPQTAGQLESIRKQLIQLELGAEDTVKVNTNQNDYFRYL